LSAALRDSGEIKQVGRGRTTDCGYLDQITRESSRLCPWIAFATAATLAAGACFDDSRATLFFELQRVTLFLFRVSVRVRKVFLRRRGDRY
jgi:hypothetical protein